MQNNNDGSIILISITNAYGDHIEYDTFTFNGGEEHIRIDSVIDRTQLYIIRANIKNSSELIRVLLINDALKRMGVSKIDLNIPYFPYARQDRVCNNGEALSVKVIASVINSCKFNSVSILDPHSDVTPALINNVRLFPQTSWLENTVDIWGKVIVSPDAGALKKATKVAQYLAATDLIVAHKVRDVRTGDIIRTDIDAKGLDGKDLVIVDDICDGGRTFIELAKAIRKQSSVRSITLVVTHGIFSNGFNELKKHINSIWTTDSFYDNKSDDYVKVVKVW